MVGSSCGAFLLCYGDLGSVGEFDAGKFIQDDGRISSEGNISRDLRPIGMDAGVGGKQAFHGAILPLQLHAMPVPMKF